MKENFIQENIYQLRKLSELKKEIDQEIKEKEEAIKKYLLINNIDEYVTTFGKVCYREIIANRFDSKSFKEKYEELYNLYLRKTKNLRFTFSY